MCTRCAKSVKIFFFGFFLKVWNSRDIHLSWHRYCLSSGFFARNPCLDKVFSHFLFAVYYNDFESISKRVLNYIVKRSVNFTVMRLFPLTPRDQSLRREKKILLQKFRTLLHNIFFILLLLFLLSKHIHYKMAGTFRCFVAVSCTFRSRAHRPMRKHSSRDISTKPLSLSVILCSCCLARFLNSNSRLRGTKRTRERKRERKSWLDSGFDSNSIGLHPARSDDHGNFFNYAAFYVSAGFFFYFAFLVYIKSPTSTDKMLSMKIRRQGSCYRRFHCKFYFASFHARQPCTINRTCCEIFELLLCSSFF